MARSMFTWWCGHSLLTIGYCLLFSLDTVHSADEAKILPSSDPFLLSGTNLTVNCTIEEGASFHASSLYFMLKDIVLSERHVSILNNRTARLSIPVYRNMSGSHLYCMSHDYDKSLDQKVLYVGDKPVKPNITSCIVDNWVNMTCYWTPEKQDTGFNTTTTLYWAVSYVDDDPCSFPKFDLPVNITGEDAIRLKGVHLGANYCIQLGFSVNTSDSRVHVKSDKVSFNTIDIVKPAAVTRFTEVEIGQRWIYLRWKSPARVIYRRVYFELNYTDQWNRTAGQIKVKSSEDNFFVGVNLTNLIPNAKYEFMLRSKPIHYDEVVGYYSNFFNYTSTTKPDVPGALPIVTPHLFQPIQSGSHVGKRGIRIFWQSVPEYYFNGELLRYVIKYCPQGDNIWEYSAAEPAFIYKDLSLKADVAYHIQIEMENGQGRNPLLPVQNISVPAEKNLLKQPRELMSVGDRKQVLLQWSAVEGALGYTVYWCTKNSNGHNCENNLEWENVTGLEWRHNMENSYTSYLISVSVYNNSSSSGVHFTECIHDASADPQHPSSFKAAEHQPKGGIALVWKHPPCHSSAYIHKYVIFYSLAEPDNNSAVRAWSNVTVNMTEESYTLTSLKKWQNYEVKIASKAVDGQMSTESPTIKSYVKGSGLQSGALVALIISSVIVVALVVLGLFTVIRVCRKKVKKYGVVSIDPPDRINIGNNEYTMSTSDGRNDIVAVTGESVAYYRCSNGDSTVQDDQKNYTSYKQNGVHSDYPQGVSNPSAFSSDTSRGGYNESDRLLEDSLAGSSNQTGKSVNSRRQSASDGQCTQGDSAMTGVSGSISPYSCIDDVAGGEPELLPPLQIPSTVAEMPSTPTPAGSPPPGYITLPDPHTPVTGTAPHNMFFPGGGDTLPDYTTAPLHQQLSYRGDDTSSNYTTGQCVSPPACGDTQSDYCVVGLAEPPHSPADNGTQPVPAVTVEPVMEGQYVDKEKFTVPSSPSPQTAMNTQTLTPSSPTSHTQPPTSPYVDNQPGSYMPKPQCRQPVSMPYVTTVP